MTARKRSGGGLPDAGSGSGRIGGLALGLGLGAAAAIGFALARRKERVPYTLSQWKAAVAADGTVPLPEFVALLDVAREKGLDLDAKRELWPYLLGLFTPGMDHAAKQAMLQRMRSSYAALMDVCKDQEQRIQSLVLQQRAVGSYSPPSGPSTSAAPVNLASESGHGAYAAGPHLDHTGGQGDATLVESDWVAVDRAGVGTTPPRNSRPPEADPGSPLGLAGTGAGYADTQGSSPGPGGPQPTGVAGGSTIWSDTQPQAVTEEQDAHDAGSTLYGSGLPGSTSPGMPGGYGGATAAGGGGYGGPGEGSPGPGEGQLEQEVPEELRQFWEAQRIIVMDAVRTDFKKNCLTAVEALTSWFSAALADSSLYQRLSAKDEWWQGYWLSALARYTLTHANHFSSDQKRQVVRLVGLLTAYAVHDPETGYCQGMSDLALPFLLLFEDDAVAFWCFEALMRKVRRNFAVDDTGIFAQLGLLAGLLEALDPPVFYKLRQVRATDCHFAYRMVVVLMRRELPLDQALRLWEMLWAEDLIAANPGYGLSSSTSTSSSLPPPESPARAPSQPPLSPTAQASGQGLGAVAAPREAATAGFPSAPNTPARTAAPGSPAGTGAGQGQSVTSSAAAALSRFFRRGPGPESSAPAELAPAAVSSEAAVPAVATASQGSTGAAGAGGPLSSTGSTGGTGSTQGSAGAAGVGVEPAGSGAAPSGVFSPGRSLERPNPSTPTCTPRATVFSNAGGTAASATTASAAAGAGSGQGQGHGKEGRAAEQAESDAGAKGLPAVASPAASFQDPFTGSPVGVSMVDAAAHAAMPMLPPQPGDLPRHRRTGSAPRLPDQLHPVLGMAGFGSQGGALHTATAGPLHGAVAGSWGGAGSAGSNSSGVTGLASVAQQQGLHTAGHTASTLAAAPGPRQDVQAQVLQELAALHLQQPTQALQEGSNAGGAVALSAGVSPFSASAQQSEHGEQALLAQAQQYQQQQEAQQLGLFMYFVAAVVISQRRRILDDCADSDDVLRAFQQAPGLMKLDVADCMRSAKRYHDRVQQLRQQGLWAARRGSVPQSSASGQGQQGQLA